MDAAEVRKRRRRELYRLRKDRQHLVDQRKKPRPAAAADAAELVVAPRFQKLWDALGKHIREWKPNDKASFHDFLCNPPDQPPAKFLELLGDVTIDESDDPDFVIPQHLRHICKIRPLPTKQTGKKRCDRDEDGDDEFKRFVDATESRFEKMNVAHQQLARRMESLSGDVLTLARRVERMEKQLQQVLNQQSQHLQVPANTRPAGSTTSPGTHGKTGYGLATLDELGMVAGDVSRFNTIRVRKRSAAMSLLTDDLPSLSDDERRVVTDLLDDLIDATVSSDKKTQKKKQKREDGAFEIECHRLAKNKITLWARQDSVKARIDALSHDAATCWAKMTTGFNRFTEDLFIEVKRHVATLRVGADRFRDTDRETMRRAILSISEKFSIHPLEVRNVIQGQFDSLRACSSQKRRKLAQANPEQEPALDSDGDS